MDSGSRLALLTRWCRVALRSLGEARAEIDALNVFPVPDGDTGTNLYLTFEAAVAALDEAAADDLDTALQSMSRGALLGARGSSGVIVSQLLRAASEQVAEAGPPGDEIAAGDMLAAALRRAADAGYAAVAEPVEGTILTVARAAAAAAGSAAERAEGPGAVITAAAAAAWEALSRTPEQLERLREAGVVDAGGRGLCVLLDAAVTALTGRRPPVEREAGRRAIPIPAAPACAQPSAGGGPAYEVMYLLDATDEDVVQLRKSLAGLGDSLVVVGGGGLWNVHVHVDDVGAAVEAGVAAGMPRRIRVTNLAERSGHRSTGRRPSRQRGVVAVAAGPGLARLFEEAGGTVLTRGPGRRFSTGEVLEAIRQADAAEVVVLPNDGDGIAVAEAAAQAARAEGVRVGVIPTRAQVQGLAAIAVHQPGRRFEDDVISMTAAAGQTRHGAVTVAGRDAMTTVGPCHAGDILGVVDGDFAVIGSELEAVAVEVMGRLLGGGGELVTLVLGDGARPEFADAVVERVRRQHPEVDTAVLFGGQERYPLLLAVE